MSELAIPADNPIRQLLPNRHDELIKNTSEEPSQRALFDYDELRKIPQEFTPVDQVTKIPLPLMPSIEKLYFDNGETTNWHHHYHPKNHPDLKSVRGLALRTVRVQLVPIQEHTKYHQLFEGPELPKSNVERFGQVVLACAGYIPRHALDVYADNPLEPVLLPDNLRTRLQKSGEIRNTGEYHIARLIRHHLVHQDFSHINENIVDEFIHTKSLTRKRHLGHYLLALASELAVEPIYQVFHQALDEGLVEKPKIKLPNLVKSKINGKKTAKQAIGDLHNRLSSSLSG